MYFRTGPKLSERVRACLKEEMFENSDVVYYEFGTVNDGNVCHALYSYEAGGDGAWSWSLCGRVIESRHIVDTLENKTMCKQCLKALGFV